MIPGKQYKPEDFLEAAWRRRWFILVPFMVIMAGTFVVTQLLPDRFRSSALLLIVPQRIPEKLVSSSVTTRLDERLQAISQEILSRTRLENIVQEFDLYPRERRRMIMEDVIEMMRTKDIIFSPPRTRGDSGSFTISYEYTDPRTAMLVTERLAGLFIRENMEDRAVLADQTDQFLQSQLQEAERQLKDREKKLEGFRRTNPGLMPAQMEANQQALQNTQLQLQALQESTNHDRDRQVWVQRQLADLAMAATMAPPSTEPVSTTPGPVTAARQLDVAKTTLKAMRMRYKPDHPDIKQLERTIAELDRKAAAEALEQPVSPVASGASNAELARASRLSELQTEDSLIQRRLSEKQEDEKRLLASMTTYRQRLEAAPGVESELTGLMRDYTTLQMSYQTLLTKSQDAKVSANLERRQIGEQFKIIDSPRMPQRPTSPNRIKYNLLGALAALALGLGLAALLEYRDTSLRSEEDIVTALALPVLALIPTMTTTMERHKRRKHKLLIASSGAVVVLVCLAVIAWKFRLNEWMW